MKTALLIGGTAATGISIARELRQRGYETTIYHRGYHEVDELSDLEHIHGDPHQESSIRNDLGNRQWDITVATYGRIRHLATVLTGRTGHFVSISGLPVVGMQPGVPTLESHGYESVSGAPMGLMGLLPRIIETEQHVLASGARGSFSATIVRYPYVYGPHSVVPMEWHVLKRVIDNRKDWILQGAGLTLSGRCASPNAARLVGLVLEKSMVSAGQIYHAADSQQYDQREWIEMVAAVMDYRFRFVDIPHAISPLGWSAIPMAGEYTWRRSADVEQGRLRHQLVANEKAKRDLGYEDVVTPQAWIGETVRHWLMHPPVLDGLSGRFGARDFDYQAEDQLIAYWERVCSSAPQVGSQLLREHPYDHPPSHTA